MRQKRFLLIEHPDCIKDGHDLVSSYLSELAFEGLEQTGDLHFVGEFVYVDGELDVIRQDTISSIHKSKNTEKFCCI